MRIDRVQEKTKAKEILRTSKPSMLLAGMYYVLLSAVIAWLSLRLTGVDNDTAVKMMEAANSGNTDAVMTMMNRSMPTPAASLLDVLLHMALSVVGVGLTLFVLNSIRNNGPVLGNLLDGFGMLPRLLALLIMESFLVFLWSLLLLIPGIIAIYRYRFAVYLLLDHPEYSALDCIRRSKEMTNGFKEQLFLLDLSFLPWAIACLLPGIGYLVEIFFVPYRETVKALYYEHVRMDRSEAGGIEYV